MKNTQENKEKFFAQYWGQEVVKDRILIGEEKENVEDVLINHRYSEVFDKLYLELKPLSEITDEDMLEIASFCYPDEDHYEVFRETEAVRVDFGTRYNVYTGNNYNDRWLGLNYNGLIQIKNVYQSNRIFNVYDSLRSKGYALPYNGISVEEQIEFGWVKFKTK